MPCDAMRIDALMHDVMLVVLVMAVLRSGGWVDGEEELRLLDVAIFWGDLLPALDPEDVPKGDTRLASFERSG